MTKKYGDYSGPVQQHAMMHGKFAIPDQDAQWIIARARAETQAPIPVINSAKTEKVKPMQRHEPEAACCDVLPRLEQVQSNLVNEYQLLSAAVAALTQALRPFRNLDKLSAEDEPCDAMEALECDSVHFNSHTDSAVVRHMVRVGRDLEVLRGRVQEVHASIVG